MSDRPVTTDALETLGMVHWRPEHRDAIHLAVEPTIAGEVLRPGQHIKILEDGHAYSSFKDSSTGIVDPFLPREVNSGERFWLVVHPRKISSLRHVWTHPDFDS